MVGQVTYRTALKTHIRTTIETIFQHMPVVSALQERMEKWQVARFNCESMLDEF